MTKPAVYGLPNCDTCRKAQKFLAASNIEFSFHDLRDPPVASAQIERWLDALGAEQLVNRRSTTWRQLTEAEREQALAGDAGLLERHPTLIKRPLVEWGDEVTVGFKESAWKARFP